MSFFGASKSLLRGKKSLVNDFNNIRVFDNPLNVEQALLSGLQWYKDEAEYIAIVGMRRDKNGRQYSFSILGSKDHIAGTPEAELLLMAERLRQIALSNE